MITFEIVLAGNRPRAPWKQSGNCHSSRRSGWL